MNEPKVIISVLNWVKFNDTIECLRHLQIQQYRAYEIIVVDNASGNDSVSRIHSAFPGVKIFELNENKGYAAGHKVSADFAIKNNCELFWILNPDATVRPDSLFELVNAYKRSGKAICGSITLKSAKPGIVNFGGGAGIKVHPFEIPFSYNLFENRLLADCREELKERRVQSVEGSSMLIPVEVIRKYGFMDTRFFLYGEETDYCLRLWNHGIPSVIVPSSAVLHKGAASFDRQTMVNPVQIYYRTRNWRLIARKYFGMKRSEMIKSKGGIITFIKFYVLWLFAGKTYKSASLANYYENLAVLHAIFNITGKQIKPEKFLLRKNEKS